MTAHLHTNLKDVPVGRAVRISKLNSEPALSNRLRELGFCENAVVRCVNKGSENIICQVYNTRIGLSHLAAGSILVSSLE